MCNKNAQQGSKSSLLLRLLSYSVPYKMRFIFALFMLAIAVSAEMAIPWVAKIVIDDLVGSKSFEWQSFSWLIGLIVFFYTVSTFFMYFQAVSFRHNALLMVNDIRKQLFRHVLNFPIHTFDKLPAGRLVSYITNDTEALRNMFVSTIPTVIQGSLRIAAIFIAIALLDWRLMLLSLLLVPILLLTMHLYRKISMPIFDEVRIRISHINEKLNESLQGITLIQSFRQENTFNIKFEQENQGWFEARRKAIAIDSLMLLPLTRLISTLTAAGIIGWFGGASLTLVVNVGTVYAFLNYIERFFDPFRQLSTELNKLQVATVSSKRIFDLLDDKSEQGFPSLDALPLSEQPNIEFRNVTFRYEEGNSALSNVSFVAKGGQFTAIVGHSGSGKSSVINLLMRFYQYQEGNILVNGHPIEVFPEYQMRQVFGLVSQDPFIFSDSVVKNIDLSNECSSKEKAIVAANQVKIHSFIERLSGGYDHHLGHSGTAFSVGEKQQLALARVIAHDPKIFLLDEATANIDSDTEEAVKEALANIQHGKTVIAVAHRLSTIQHADQILVMRHGNVVQSGTHQELITLDGDYRDLYLAQQAQEKITHQNHSLGLVEKNAL